MNKQFREKDEEFYSIVDDILKNDRFRELDNEIHHGITRYGHSFRVAKATYKYTKMLNLDYVQATRAALLHDFFTKEEISGTKLSAFTHPLIAANNAKKFFELSVKEENIIKAHMFPLAKTMPKYAESWVVTIVDKTVASWELYRYRFSTALGICAIFIFNMITLQK